MYIVWGDLMNLDEYFAQDKKFALGFSGGVDSAYILYKALECGADIRPYFLKTPFQTEAEMLCAEEFAKQLGCCITVIDLNILQVPDVKNNGRDRCYFCKKALFEELSKRAISEGYLTIIDGTNASDDISDRPGFMALTELGVQSPLRMCGITKDVIRKELHNAGFSLWNRPANACLATRIPENTKIESCDLYRIAEAEQVLHSMGFYDLRVRIFEDAARIQLKEEQLNMAIMRREDILNRFKPFFENVLIDLKVR